jgi:hypothetical protein
LAVIICSGTRWLRKVYINADSVRFTKAGKSAGKYSTFPRPLPHSAQTLVIDGEDKDIGWRVFLQEETVIDPFLGRIECADEIGARGKYGRDKENTYRACDTHG